MQLHSAWRTSAFDNVAAWPPPSAMPALLSACSRERLSVKRRLARLVFYGFCSVGIRQSWLHWQWLRGLLETIISAIICFRWLPYQKELLRTPEDKTYCVWWPSGQPKVGFRCWVLVSGGMGISSGRHYYTTSFCTSSAVGSEECCVVFHNPGQGGCRVSEATFDSAHFGLTRIDCLTHFLRHLRDSFQHIVVVGFSAGGMPVMAMAQEENAIADAFISICTPERIRLVLEEHARWWFRLDVFFTLWFYLRARAGGLYDIVPFKKFPWPPTWSGYMRPFMEKAFAESSGQHRRFEELEYQHFDASIKRKVKVPCLRVFCKDDPIVLAETLSRGNLQDTEVWWESRGGHCGQFLWCRDFPRRLRSWVLQSSFKRSVSA